MARFFDAAYVQSLTTSLRLKRLVLVPQAPTHFRFVRGRFPEGRLNTFNWQGHSGRWFEFEIARAQRAWEPAGGVYLFVKPHDQPSQDWGGPICLFAAQTHDFSTTLTRHDMWQAAENLGAKEIHLLMIKDDQTRTRVLKDILEAQAPILNRNMMRRVA